MSRRRHYLLTALLLCWASESWGANAYQSRWLSTYCAPNPGISCNIYWPMDETAGTTLNNTCGQSCQLTPAATYSMTTVNSPSLNQAGVNSARGTSVAFVGGTPSYAESSTASDGATGPGDISDAFSITVGCWTKATNVATTQVALSANNETYAQAVTDSAQYRTWNLGFNSSTARFALLTSLSDGNNTLAAINGGTTLTNSVWYFMVGRWNHGTPGGVLDGSIDLFLNGTADAANVPVSTASINGPPEVKHFSAAIRSSFDAPQPLTGNLQDCFVVHTSIPDAQIKIIYDSGVGTVDDWPYNVKLDVPKFRDDGWMDKLFARGYVTGRFTGKALVPNIFAPYPPLAAMLPGNAK